MCWSWGCETPVGYIDLVTSDVIIEIKEISQWKAALGQIISYGEYHQEKSKELYLFGSSTFDKGPIISICSKYGVKVTFYSDYFFVSETRLKV